MKSGKIWVFLSPCLCKTITTEYKPQKEQYLFKKTIFWFGDPDNFSFLFSEIRGYDAFLPEEPVLSHARIRRMFRLNTMEYIIPSGGPVAIDSVGFGRGYQLADVPQHTMHHIIAIDSELITRTARS